MKITLSVSDDISSQLQDKLEQGVTQAVRTLPNLLNTAGSAVSGAGRTISGAVSGIALVIKAPVLTAKGIMAAAGRMGHNPKYSKQNISIEELEKNSDIKKVDEGITRDVMKYFDKSCRKYGVSYSAVVDKANPKEPAYYIFFKGKETPVIEQALKEAYKEYVQEQAKPHASVRAKLAFFRKRVTARDQEQQDLGKEKHNNRADRQR
ncbi:MAG: PcfB family protein [Lachnospiraceae bacterium]|nr:PcfB family protein [Lachnospiraceae bacterium]